MVKKIFKGYLRYKTITSQNVSSEAQVKNFIILQKSSVLKIFKLFLGLNIFKISSHDLPN